MKTIRKKYIVSFTSGFTQDVFWVLLLCTSFLTYEVLGFVHALECVLTRHMQLTVIIYFVVLRWMYSDRHVDFFMSNGNFMPFCIHPIFYYLVVSLAK